MQERRKKEGTSSLHLKKINKPNQPTNLTFHWIYFLEELFLFGFCTQNGPNSNEYCMYKVTVWVGTYFDTHTRTLIKWFSSAWLAEWAWVSLARYGWAGWSGEKHLSFLGFCPFFLAMHHYCAHTWNVWNLSSTSSEKKLSP